MFEAAISPAVSGTGTPGALRPLEWSEIVARLAAARDVRGLFARSGSGAASFGARAAAGLQRDSAGEREINFAALEGGKTGSAIDVATVEEDAVGDQGTR